jgi:diacylglycerol kinase (ATP)
MAANPVILFVNPTAGRGRAGRQLSRLTQLSDDSGIGFELQTSRGVGDMESRITDYVNRGVQQIVVVGGDGSVHEAVNGIMRADGDARLGVIPIGTGNDFAKASHIPLDWEEAARLLIGRMRSGTRWRRIDIGRMNERYFANGVGIGFDAKVTKVARSIRWPVGQFVYLFALIRCLADGVITPDMTIASHELNLDGPITLANVSNGAWVGGMFHMAPTADNADGWLELLVAAPVTRRRVLSLLPKILAGKHVAEPEVSHASVRRVTIRSAGPVPSHLDGEVMPPMREFEIELLPAALDLL